MTDREICEAKFFEVVEEDITESLCGYCQHKWRDECGADCPAGMDWSDVLCKRFFLYENIEAIIKDAASSVYDWLEAARMG